MAGHIALDLAPGQDNPRNSEGAFIEAGQELLFCYSRFAGSSDADHAVADIACIRSRDGGKSWSAPEIIVTRASHDAMNIMSVSLLALDEKRIGLFYLVRKTWDDLRLFLRVSDDAGRSWSEPGVCMPRKGYFVVNNDRVIRLASSRILVPAAEHHTTVHPGNWASYSPSSATFFFSDDNGQTWREAGALVALAGVRSAAGLQEPGVLELKDGSIYAWVRTDLGCQYQFASTNQGFNWSAAGPGPFTSPLSPLSMKRLQDGRLLAVWNPIPDYQTRTYHPRTGGRNPLIAALSADDGQHWKGPIILEDDPDSGYCYTAIYETAEAVLLAYCAGSTIRDTACLNRLRIRYISKPELSEGAALQDFPMYGIGC